MNKIAEYPNKKITIAHLEDVLDYPPVINLVEVLLAHRHKVYFVGYNIQMLPDFIIEDPNFQYTELPKINGNNVFARFKRGISRNRLGRAAVIRYMKEADYLWTTTDLTCRCLGKLLFDYRHIMQLMELDVWYPYIKDMKWPKFPIAEYARKAWKVVEPELNRAHIQKTIWKLPKTPCVFPNKNYNINLGKPAHGMEQALAKVNKEERKILFYMGTVIPEREIEPFMEAVETLKDEYCLYVAGYISDQHQQYYQDLFARHEATEYLGVFPAPKHLLLLEKAYIGLLPYKPGMDKTPYRSELNALYCAPNKIFEYSGYGIPMISTDVLALREPFEKYDMGICLEVLDTDHIVSAIRQIESKHKKMSDNCIFYYNSIDLDEIIENILRE